MRFIGQGTHFTAGRADGEREGALMSPALASMVEKCADEGIGVTVRTRAAAEAPLGLGRRAGRLAAAGELGPHELVTEALRAAGTTSVTSS